VAYLRQAAGPKYDRLIADLFQKITIYDLRAKSASWTKRPDGKYDVTLTVAARKYYASGKGKETQTPMQETVPVGAFTMRPGEAGFGRKIRARLADSADPHRNADRASGDGQGPGLRRHRPLCRVDRPRRRRQRRRRGGGRRFIVRADMKYDFGDNRHPLAYWEAGRRHAAEAGGYFRCAPVLFIV
jgi:hypothetical protein